MSDDLYKRMLEWRHIEPSIDTVCSRCNGSGVRVYGNTATWTRGIGGQTMTSDICDKCWGSGKEDKPWINLRILRNRVRDLKDGYIRAFDEKFTEEEKKLRVRIPSAPPI